MRTSIRVFLPSFAEIGKAEVTKREYDINHEKVGILPLCRATLLIATNALTTSLYHAATWYTPWSIKTCDFYYGRLCVTENNYYILRRVFSQPTFSAVSKPIFSKLCHTTSFRLLSKFFKVPLGHLHAQPEPDPIGDVEPV